MAPLLCMLHACFPFLPSAPTYHTRIPKMRCHTLLCEVQVDTFFYAIGPCHHTIPDGNGGILRIWFALLALPPTTKQFHVDVGLRHHRVYLISELLTAHAPEPNNPCIQSSIHPSIHPSIHTCIPVSYTHLTLPTKA